MSNWKASYDALSDIMRKGAYVNLTLNKLDDKDRAFVTQVVNGTLENYFEIDSIIKATSSRAPQASIKVLLMQAIYAIRYMNVPAYAVVNENVNLAEELGKEALKGYVNALLKRVCDENYELPDFDEPRFEEIKYKMPLWLINVVKESYPDNYDEILSVEKRREVHVRLSPSIRPTTFEQKVGDFEKTRTGYYVTVSRYVKKLFETGKLTYQSYTSTLAVDAIGPVKNKEVLDVCAAPGGKSVYIAQKGGIVTACDIHPHRLALVKAYAERMNVNLKCFQNDAMEFRPDWGKSFDVVLVDAPCSGLGVISKRRDIIFKKSIKEIKELTEIQTRMLDVAALYVKRGGILLYSTCTILKMENNDIIENFLKKHKAYSLAYEEQFLPSSDGTDGFYIAKIIRRA
ncbi:MAG: methyltransferase domain-containing protein [Christensenellaceae bacterium]|jgi:16S rRNA (cytosine967-C5)-methyltransferase|nr:methyltransferase domain-containing protein [Christensenellaceae bacterium]